MTWVYGFQCQGFIKVGVAQSLGTRRKQLQAGNPFPLKIVLNCRCVDGAYYLERRIHEILAEHAIGREWFAITPQQLRDAVERAKIDLEGKRVAQAGWEFASAERAEQRKAEKEARRLARGEAERAALVDQTWSEK